MPRPPSGSKSIFQTQTPPGELVRLSLDALDELVHGNGVRLIHYQAMACPIGKNDVDDIRVPHADHSGCSNGFLYHRAGVLKGYFAGNSNQNGFSDFGATWSAQAQVIFDRFYEEADGAVDADVPPGGGEVIIAHFDRIYFADPSILAPAWELIQVSGSGRERLRYPAVAVDRAVDSHGQEYRQHLDFDINDKGLLVWKAGRPHPQYSVGTEMGQVLSLRYTYRPYFYVKDLVHDIRVVAAEDENGNQVTRRMFQTGILLREFFYEGSAKADAEAKNIDDLRVAASAPAPNQPPR